MADFYIRQDCFQEVDSKDLLQWSEGIAARASAEDVYRNREGRVTLRFEHNHKSYFMKMHRGIGWGEIIKNLLQLRLPILGASNEYHAVNALQALGVDTMDVAAYGSEGINPASLHSIIITDDLSHTISLEDYCEHWSTQPPSFKTKLKIILKVADSAARMHAAGINHRDFYICHFHLDPASLNKTEVRCHIIDLHRAQMRQQVPKRWLVKDLGGLFFSAMDCGLSKRDILRFLKAYSPGGLRQAFGQDRKLWQSVEQAAIKLYRKDHGREPPNWRWVDG